MSSKLLFVSYFTINWQLFSSEARSGYFRTAYGIKNRQNQMTFAKSFACGHTSPCASTAWEHTVAVVDNFKSPRTPMSSQKALYVSFDNEIARCVFKSGPWPNFS